MQFIRLQLALQTAALAIPFSAASAPDYGGKLGFSKPNREAKVEWT